MQYLLVIAIISTLLVGSYGFPGVNNEQQRRGKEKFGNVLSYGPYGSVSKRSNVLNNGDCKVKKGSMNVYVAGCNIRRIVSAGCFGYCMSVSTPDFTSNRDNFKRVCSCCQPTEYEVRKVVLYCPGLSQKWKALRIFVAKQCKCRPC